ncbi:MAG: polysaccharide deacetylase family protein [Candidatus Promineofilum sp.]|nr:polysaccharide deacetylase family protein [Promineifilum sp.]MBP9657253.1 polysaccharide deacetylase family protein [Promineifilum sp.]
MGIVLALGLLSAACSGGGTPEPTVDVPTEVTEVEAVKPPPLVTPSIIQTLPTPAETPMQPSSPTPPPTASTDVDATGTAIVQATQTAALSPPTPPVTEEAATPAPTEAIANEPLPTPMGIYSWTLKVPILMYHYVSEPPPGSDIYRTDLSVSPNSFRQQMAFLSENGYTPVDLYTLSLAIVNQATLPEKPVILTFDDGYLDMYDHVFPVLQEYGFTGTFFIISDYIDQEREGYMTWDMVTEMAQAGHRIESHSKTHPDLSQKSRDVLIYEILGAQETIAAHTGTRPRYFCYPGGTYNGETIAVLKELDYWGAVTTQNGTWHGFDDRFEWRRVRIRNTTTIEEYGYLLDLEGTLHGKPPG